MKDLESIDKIVQMCVCSSADIFYILLYGQNWNILSKQLKFCSVLGILHVSSFLQQYYMRICQKMGELRHAIWFKITPLTLYEKWKKKKRVSIQISIYLYLFYLRRIQYNVHYNVICPCPPPHYISPGCIIYHLSVLPYKY